MGPILMYCDVLVAHTRCALAGAPGVGSLIDTVHCA